MNAVDIVIVVILLVSLLIGLRRGFIRETLSLLSWIAALWAAYLYATPAGEFLRDTIASPALRTLAAAAAIFVGALFALSLLGHWLSRLLSVSGISGVDRSLGMLFGILRGALIIAVAMLIVVFTSYDSHPWWQESLLVDMFIPVANMLVALLPNNIAVSFADALR